MSDEFNIVPPATPAPNDSEFNVVKPAAPAAPASQEFNVRPALTQLNPEAPPGYVRGKDGLEPAGLIDPPEPDPNSLQEDARRAKEWAQGLPGRLMAKGIRSFEYISDIPATQLFIRQANGDPLAVQKWLELNGGENLAADNAKQVSENPWGLFGAFAEGGRVKPEEALDLHVDMPITAAGASARQVTNIAAHKTLGRGWKTFQRTAGKPIAQMAHTLTKEHMEFERRESERRKGLYGYDPYGEPLPPEAEEMLSREFYSFLAGPDYRLDEQDPKTNIAVAQLQKQYGIHGAAFAQSFARELGGLPAYVVVSGVGAEMAAGERAVVGEIAQTAGPQAMKRLLPQVTNTLKRAAVKEGVGEGLTQGFVQAAVRDGEDVFEGAGFGALLGGAFGLFASLNAAKQARNTLWQGLGQRGENKFAKAVEGNYQSYDRSTVPFTEFDEHVGGVLMSPETTKEFNAQLDELIKRTQFKKRSKTEVAARAVAETNKKFGNRVSAQAEQTGVVDDATTMEFEKLAAEGERSPDFDIEVETAPVGPMKPTGSMLAINDQGQLVMRDVEVTAIREKDGHRVSKGEVPVERKTTKMVETHKPEKGTEGPVGPTLPLTENRPARTVKPPPTAVGGRLAVKVRARDTVIKDYNQFLDLVSQNGRRMIPAMVDSAANGMLDQMARVSDKDTSIVGTFGKFHNVAPEALKKGAPLEVWEAKAKFFEDQRQAIKDKFEEARRALIQGESLSISDTVKPDPAVLTVNEDGSISTTVIRPNPPKRPTDYAIEGGDTVLIDGEASGTVIGVNERGATVELPNGTVVEVPKASLTHIPREFYKPAHEGRPIIGAKPGSMVDDRTLNIIKGMDQGVTVPKLMQIAGREDPTWAAAALRQLEAKGVVKEVEPGRFVASKVKSIVADIPANGQNKPGYAVYIGTGGPQGKGDIAILRGRDPRNPKNWLVELPNYSAGGMPHPTAGKVFKNTRIESVPEEAVRTMKPVGYADKKMVKLGIDLEGWNKPMPSDYYQMSEATLGDTEALSQLYSKVNSQPSWLTRMSRGMQEAIAGAMHTAPDALRRSKAQQLWSLAGMMRSEGMVRTKFLERKLALGTAASHEFTKVLEATRSRSPNGKTSLNAQELQKWVQKYPEEAKACLDDFKKMVAESDEYTAFLVANGVTDIDAMDTARAAGLIDEYLTRNYAAFQMPRAKWAEYAKKNMTQAWKDSVDWLVKNRPGVQFSTAAAELDEILRLENPIKALEERGYIKAEGTKKLIGRVDVPEPFRRLLGEHQDAAVRLAFTVAYQRQLVKGIDAWNNIAQHPGLWSPGWRPDMTLRVPDRPIFGKARNGYVPDNSATRALLGDRPLTSNEESGALLRAVGWAGRQWKASHTVYNQVSWANNAVRNLKGVLLSGGFSEPADMEGFRDAARMLMDYEKDPTIYGPNKLLIEAMDFDAVGPGLAGSELSTEERNFASRLLRTFQRTQGRRNGFLDALSEAREFALTVPERIHNGYDFVDKWAKLGSYLNLRRRFIAEGMSVHDAAAMASLRVNQSFQNFPRSPGKTKNLAVAAPFLSSKLEDLRINATLVKRLTMDGETDLAWRLLSAGALFGGAATLALKAQQVNGISSAQDQAERSNLTVRSKANHPFLIGSLDYDQHGRRVYYDLSPYEDALMWFRGNPQDPLLARILFNNIEDIVGKQTLMGDAVMGVGAWSGALHPEGGSPLPRPDQVGVLNLMQQYGMGFLPQGLVNIDRNMGRMNPTGRLVNPEAFTPDQALVHSLTGRVNAIAGPQSQTQTLMETARNIKGAESNLNKGVMDAALTGASPERLDYVIKSNVRELEKKVNIPRPLKTKENK